MNRLRLLWYLLPALLTPVGARATENAATGAWRFAGDGMLYAYAERTWRDRDSLFNPDNRVARLPEVSATSELRGNLELENDTLRLYLRPIAVLCRTDTEGAGERQEVYLSQWQARLRPSGTLSLSAGRDLLNWGPGQFRSPSSPFYFNNGRSNPLRELSGIDNVKMAWTPTANRSFLLARITGSGHDAFGDDPWRDSWLAKGELRGEAWAVGLALARAPHQEAFVGGYGQWTLDDAWLAYGEAASNTLSDVLVSPADPDQPWTVAEESPRRGRLLLGLAYTMENGQILSAEYLWNGHGWNRDEVAAHCARAETAATLPLPLMGQTLGQALAQAPDLLGRNYLHLIWQNSLLSGEDIWRLMYSHSLDDGSGQAAFYAEHPLSGALSCFFMGVMHTGGGRREFGQLIGSSLLAGLRLAFP